MAESGRGGRQRAAAEALGVAVAARVPVLLWGAPGTGKTSAIRAMAGGHGLAVRDGHRLDPGALGLRRAAHRGRRRGPVRAPGLGPAAGEAGRGLLFLDELSTAPPAVQAALLRVVLERVVGDLTCRPRSPWWPRPTRRSRPRTAGTCPRRWPTGCATWPGTSTRARSPTGWPAAGPRRWCRSCPKAGRPRRPALALWSPRSCTSGRRWPAPRRPTPPRPGAAGRPRGPGRWRPGYGPRAARPASARKPGPRWSGGAVGDGAGVEFLAWLAEMDLPDPEAVLADPASFRLPERGDRAYAALAAVAAAVAADPTPDAGRPAGRCSAWPPPAPDVAAVAARVLARCRPDGVRCRPRSACSRPCCGTPGCCMADVAARSCGPCGRAAVGGGPVPVPGQRVFGAQVIVRHRASGRWRWTRAGGCARTRSSPRPGPRRSWAACSCTTSATCCARTGERARPGRGRRRRRRGSGSAVPTRRSTTTWSRPGLSCPATGAARAPRRARPAGRAVLRRRSRGRTGRSRWQRRPLSGQLAGLRQRRGRAAPAVAGRRASRAAALAGAAAAAAGRAGDSRTPGRPGRAGRAAALGRGGAHPAGRLAPRAGRRAAPGRGRYGWRRRLLLPAALTPRGRGRRRRAARAAAAGARGRRGLRHLRQHDRGPARRGAGRGGRAARRLGLARQLRVLACDTAVGAAQRVTSARQVELTGGGGTDMGAGICRGGRAAAPARRHRRAHRRVHALAGRPPRGSRSWSGCSARRRRTRPPGRARYGYLLARTGNRATAALHGVASERWPAHDGDVRRIKQLTDRAR